MENVKRINQVTLPPISRKGHDVLYIKVLTDLRMSEIVDEADDGRKPATTCRVINLEDGKTYEYIASALAVTALRRYAESVVGKCFEIVHSKEKVPGKDYYGVDVYEIECPIGHTDVPKMFGKQAD